MANVRLLATHLFLDRCPHCAVDRPNLPCLGNFAPRNSLGQERHWKAYACSRCAGVVIATADAIAEPVRAVYPSSRRVEDDIPERARAYLAQALGSLSAPSGAVMLAASAVDAMLKEKGLKTGKLYKRIDEAAAGHLITPSMAEWAHDVRLDANDERHADEAAPLPDEAQAKKCVDFALALGEFLFVLPARVERGIKAAKESPTPPA